MLNPAQRRERGARHQKRTLVGDGEVEEGQIERLEKQVQSRRCRLLVGVAPDNPVELKA